MDGTNQLVTISTKEEVTRAYVDIITRYEKNWQGKDIAIIGPSISSGMTIVFTNNRITEIQMGEHPN